MGAIEMIHHILLRIFENSQSFTPIINSAIILIKLYAVPKE